MEIKAEVTSIENLKDYFFVVPDYQREYVWQSDSHVVRFLQDIWDEFSPNTEKQSNYFIGSTIIVKREDGLFDVVDGQQRLTTIVISLCAIRFTLKSLEQFNWEFNVIKNELVKAVGELLYKYDISARRHTPRLVLQYDESKDYLTKLIAGEIFDETPTPSILKMISAYETVLNFLNDLDPADGTLINFIGYFLTNVEMVIIKPDNLGSALKIFETINERGVGLNAMDLLKNLLFSHSDEKDFSIIKDTWKSLLASLDECEEGNKPLRFLRYFLIARYHNGILREDEIYKWMISDEGKRITNYKNDPVGFSKELKTAAAKYSQFIRATIASDAHKTYPSITGIGYLSKKTSRQHLVLLMALKDNIDLRIINALAENLESLIFYYSVNRILTKSYEEKFANWATKIRRIITMEDLKIFLLNDFKTEFTEQRTRFNSQFDHKSQGDLNPQYRVKYIFGKIEEFVRSKVNFPSANYSYYQNLQLEHVLPQTGENIPVDKYPMPYDYQNTVYRFGNLTLLEAPINQSINYTNNVSDNQWFNIKKRAYLNSNIILTRTFSEIKIGEQTIFNGFANAKLKTFDVWDISTVAERQEILRKLILDVWKLEI